MPDNDFKDLKEAGMNVDGGLKYTFDKERFLAALQRFYRRSESNISAIGKSIEEKEHEELVILVHALKSNARTIGADTLGDIAEKMELSGKDRKYDEMLSLSGELLENYKRILEIIKPYGLMEEVHPASEISAGEAEKAGKERLESLEDFDDERSLELIDTLMRYPFRFTLINVLKNAREDIKEYEYREALLKIRRVVSQIED